MFVSLEPKYVSKIILVSTLVENCDSHENDFDLRAVCVCKCLVHIMIKNVKGHFVT